MLHEYDPEVVWVKQIKHCSLPLSEHSTFSLTIELWPCSVGKDQPTFCTRHWIPYAGHCYYLQRTKKMWRDALAACHKDGGDLASIHNIEEQSFIISQSGYSEYTIHVVATITSISDISVIHYKDLSYGLSFLSVLKSTLRCVPINIWVFGLTKSSCLKSVRWVS